MSSKKGMLFIQGEDRPGIIKKVTQYLYEAGANLEDVSMTLLENQFAMMISFQADKKSWAKAAANISDLQNQPWKLNASLIELHGANFEKSKVARSVLITAIGRDRTGIIYHVSSSLAAIRANITNLDCRILRSSKKNPLYSFALEVDLLRADDLKKVSALIQKWKKSIGIEAHLHISESAVF